MWEMLPCCQCVCLIMCSLRLGLACKPDGLACTQAMLWFTHTCTHTLLNLTALHRVNKQDEFLNFSEPLPTRPVLKCERSLAEWFHLAAFGREMSATWGSLPPSPPHLQLILEACAHPQEAQKGPTVCPWFNKDTIHAGKLAKGCLIKREYPLPRPQTACTQGEDCEAHSAFIVERNVWTPTWQPEDTGHVHAHTHNVIRRERRLICNYFHIVWVVF